MLWSNILTIVAIVFAVVAVVFSVVTYVLYSTHHHRTIQVEAVIRKEKIEDLRHGSLVRGRELQHDNVVMSYNTNKEVEFWRIRDGDRLPVKHPASHGDLGSISHGQATIPIIRSSNGYKDLSIPRFHTDALILKYGGFSTPDKHLIPYSSTRNSTPLEVTLNFHRGVEHHTGIYRCNMDLILDISDTSDTTPISLVFSGDKITSGRDGSGEDEEYYFQSGNSHLYVFDELSEALTIGSIGSSGFEPLTSHPFVQTLAYDTKEGGLSLTITNTDTNVIATAADIATHFSLDTNEIIRIEYNLDS
jgi:hypothetical protein